MKSLEAINRDNAPKRPLCFPWPLGLQATCSHDGSRIPEQRITLLDELIVIRADINRCYTCGAWLSLGPSSDRIPADEMKLAKAIAETCRFWEPGRMQDVAISGDVRRAVRK